VKWRSMVLAAIQAVTDADPIWHSRSRNSNAAAEASSGKSVHAASPSKSDGRDVYSQPVGRPRKMRQPATGAC
jgi:hypothetical protein